MELHLQVGVHGGAGTVRDNLHEHLKFQMFVAIFFPGDEWFDIADSWTIDISVQESTWKEVLVGDPFHMSTAASGAKRSSFDRS